VRSITVHQLVSGFADGDAISHEALALRNICRDLKFSSEIYAPEGSIAPGSAAECHGLGDYRQKPSDVVIYHYSIASPATEAFLSSPARKVLVYHNITPAEFYAPFDDAITDQLVRAREGLRTTALKADAVWAVSNFNAAELRAAGIGNVRVFPLVFQWGALDLEPDPVVMRQFAVPMKNILFVGRIAPNKCIEELITAFAWFSREVDPQSRLIIVGSDRTTPAYFSMLRMYVGELELPNVCFQRFALPAGLAAYYRLAHLFVTASRHEGYCLPLIEAMYRGVPVIARETGGTPEAMGNAGVLYGDLRPEELAELMALVLQDAPLRNEILASQKQRIETLMKRPMQEEFLSLLSPLVPTV